MTRLTAATVGVIIGILYGVTLIAAQIEFISGAHLLKWGTANLIAFGIASFIAAFALVLVLTYTIWLKYAEMIVFALADIFEEGLFETDCRYYTRTEHGAYCEASEQNINCCPKKCHNCTKEAESED